ncbi:MAG TPA: histidine phosphatase family protein [Candidatus Limnocylindria bacterium]|nr:histidine phosphatase family protein [Candidatus Limnocylindria bacterium]
MLVKHSAVVPVRGTPPSTWELSSEGQRRAAALGERLRPFPCTRITASDEPKAAETARIAARALGVPVLTDPDLREHRRERAPFLASDDAFRDAVREVLARRSEVVFGEESADAAHERFARGVERAMAVGPGDTVVVAHGTVIALYVSRRAAVDAYALWSALGLPSYVVLGGDGRVLEVAAEISP